MENVARELGFEDIGYGELQEHSYSTFCKLNPNSLKYTHWDKIGYLIGPTLVPRDNDEDENTTHDFEIFSPKIYFSDKTFENELHQYRLIVFWAFKFTFWMWVEEEHLKQSLDVYQKLSDFLTDKAKTMEQKVDPIVEYNDEKPLDPEDTVKLIYFNSANLAIKQTHRFTRKLWTSEIRHFINLIKTKFDDNQDLLEYQVTTSSYWVVGKRSLPRIFIVILPLILSQGEAIEQAKAIYDKYFPYL